MATRRTIPIRVTYKCSECPGYCCTYDQIPVTERDLRRLAGHFAIDVEAARKRFTKKVEGAQSMRHRRDHVFKSTCMMFDGEQRRCTIYSARPQVCRDYPGTKCGYYNFLKWERDLQEDQTYVPSISG